MSPIRIWSCPARMSKLSDTYMYHNVKTRVQHLVTLNKVQCLTDHAVTLPSDILNTVRPQLNSYTTLKKDLRYA